MPEKKTPKKTAPPPVVVPETNVAALLQTTVQQLGMAENPDGVVAAIERLVDLKLKLDERDAEREFNIALAAFQGECPTIAKTSTAKIVTKGGSEYQYKYAELDEIQRTVNPLLHKRGLSFNWDSSTEGSTIKCVCYLRHVNGHCVTATFQSPIPASLGSMNDIQKNAAVLTYIKRQSLVEVLGIVTSEEDVDAADPTTISDEQQQHLQRVCGQVNADMVKFREYMGVKQLNEIRVVDYQKALNALEVKRKQNEDAKKKEQPQPEEGKLL